MYRKVARKCFLGCEGKSQLFSLPKDEGTRKSWEVFMFSGQQPPHSNVALCALHFTNDHFVNKGQYDAGFASQLLLKHEAVPSIRSFHGGSRPQASTYQQPPGACVGQTYPAHTVCVATQVTSEKVSVGTQISLSFSTRSAGTQLSYLNMKEHVRSKGTQTAVSCVSVDAGFLPSSSPEEPSAAAPGVRPAKRPLLEFLKEEEEIKEEEEEEEIMTDIQQAHDFTHQPGESRTNPSQISEMEYTSCHNELKYLVFESCLRELFQTCPVCNGDCYMRQHEIGTYVAFNQHCPNCQYTREWESQPIRGRGKQRQPRRPTGSHHISNPLQKSQAEMHPSIIEKEDRLKCTTVSPFVFGCPLCPKFTTKSKSVIQRHLVNHETNAVHFTEKIICRCNLPCRDGGHFHCPFCGNTIIRKGAIRTHLIECKNKFDVAQLTPSQPPSPEIHPTILSLSVEHSYFVPPPVSPRKMDHSYTQKAPPKTPADATDFKKGHVEPVEPEEPEEPDVSQSPPATAPEEPDVSQSPPATAPEGKDVSQSPPATASEDPIAPENEVTWNVPPTHVKCLHCPIVLYRKNLVVHIKRKHGKGKDMTAHSHLQSTSVDQSSGHYAVMADRETATCDEM